jgi:23S rRNA (cytosine1962-C5)-methyltransferase
MIRLVLKSGREASVRRRHPWLFSGAIARTEGDGSDGLARVVSASGQPLASGAYSPESAIVARLWSFESDGESDLGPELIAARFSAARRLREAVVPPDTTGFRAINSEGDRCPGVTLDIYGAAGVLELATESLRNWTAPLREAALRTWGIEHLSIRSSGTVADRALWIERQRSAAAADVEPTLAPEPSNAKERAAFREEGLNFFADLSSGQKTGFFLDQRDNRSRARALARGRRVLNLFSYSGGFSIAALAGGASRAVDVDSSEGALALAREHRVANGFPADPADFVRADVFDDLRRRVDAGETWDLVVCDPPAFAKKRADVDRAARGYKDVNRLAMRLVGSGGLLLTCSCSGTIDPVLFQKSVFSAELESGGRFSFFARQGAGADHPVSLDCPEGEYLKGMWLERSSNS